MRFYYTLSEYPHETVEIDAPCADATADYGPLGCSRSTKPIIKLEAPVMRDNARR